MIDYDPHHWRSHLFDVRGSMVREIFARVFTCVLWSALVVVSMRYVDFPSFQIAGLWFDIDPEDLQFPTTAHSLLGVALSLLLVFRTNSSYDRFWEGRKLWGTIVNESRNLARQSHTYLVGHDQLRNEIVRWTIGFAYASMYKLRDEKGLGEVAKRLGTVDTHQASSANHPPLHATMQISSRLREAHRAGIIGENTLISMDHQVQQLIDALGGCERIHRTPMPFAYMVHLRRAVILYCFTLPLALYADYGWATIGVTFLIAYTFFGIEEIGVTIEDPFEGEDNDLPLEDICAVINSNLSAIIGDSPDVSPSQPVKLSNDVSQATLQ